MLTLTTAQISTLRTRRLSGFRERLLRHVARRFPISGPDDASLAMERLIGDGMVLAAKHGMRSERDICRFIEIFCLLERCRDRAELEPWAVRILTSTDLDPRAKVDHVHRRVAAAVRDQGATALRASDPAVAPNVEP